MITFITHPFAVASATSAIAAAANAGVGLIKKMPMNTMGYQSSAPTAIYFCGNWLQMVRVHTLNVAAKMVKLKIFWDWPSNQLIRITMGHNSLARMLAKCESAISTCLCFPNPNPACLGFINISPEALFERAKAWYCHWVAMSSQTHVVLLAQPLTGTSRWTLWDRTVRNWFCHIHIIAQPNPTRAT